MAIIFIFQTRAEMLRKHFNKSQMVQVDTEIKDRPGHEPLFLLRHFAEFGLS